MKLALTQMNIAWELPTVNKETCERLIMQAEQNACDYIVFPEMTLTGFTMHPDHFVPNDACTFFSHLAKVYHIGIVFGYIDKADSGYHNKMAIADCYGNIIYDYAKIHPFSYGEESKHYIGGDDISTFHMSSDTLNNIASAGSFSDAIYASGFICYDLRFPEIFQMVSRTAAIIFVIANWPESRVEHWQALLKARAIENQCYMIGVNRTGEGNGIHYIPSSAAFDPYGNSLAPRQTSEVIYADIHPDTALQYRQTFPVKEDRRDDLYKILTTK